MNIDDNSILLAKIESIDFKLRCIQDTAEELATDLDDQADIDLVLNKLLLIIPLSPPSSIINSS